MHDRSRLWSAIGAALILLWSYPAVAQSSGSASGHPPANAAARTAADSTVSNSLICDSSGNICAPGKQAAGPAKPSAVQAADKRAPSSPAPTAANLPHRAATPQLPSKQQSLGASQRLQICDESGRICATVGGEQAPGSTTSTGSAAMPGGIDGLGVSQGRYLPTDDPLAWAVHAYKSRHRLEVYFNGHLYRTYHAVFGRNLVAGAKLRAGDRRTPEGNYLIIGKRRSARFGWFLHINYPNEQDHARFKESRAAHLVPAGANEGGQIGIHGTDSPYLNVAEIDWTTGCISVDNTDIWELAHMLPVGTLVTINP
jgi:lipoprotein-anchoring transpeptidase ErfK/SrfK